MNEVDKKYMAFDTPEEEHPDTWDFVGQQVRGLIALAAIVLGLWMIVGSVVAK